MGPIDFSSRPDVSVVVTQYIWQTPDEQVGGMKALDVKMRPDRSFVVSGVAAGAHYRGISERGQQYALYHHHSELKP